MITKHALIPSEIPFLRKRQTLYVSDFRAISESMLYRIPTMWKYENLLPWILDGQQVATNEDAGSITYPQHNTLLCTEKASDPRISVFERIEKCLTAQSGLSALWVAIPHPKADELASKYQMSLNYAYSDFERYNDKIQQKKILDKYTPIWRKINSIEELEKIINSYHQGFIKRRFGSGGYTVFPVSKTQNDQNFKNLFSQSPNEWYFESFAEGIPYSIQCVRNKELESIIVFGFTQQLVSEGKHFVGSDIFPLKNLSGAVWKQLEEILLRINYFLHGYEGFFGIDFMINQSITVSVLEANVRLTAATIPTLVMNAWKKTKAEYREDVPFDQIKPNDTILTNDTFEQTSDILRFS